MKNVQHNKVYANPHINKKKATRNYLNSASLKYCFEYPFFIASKSTQR